MRTAQWLRRSAAMALSLTLVAAVTYGGTASAAGDGFSVDDFNGNSMGTRSVVTGPSNMCDFSDNAAVTVGSGTMKVAVTTPDSRGCNYASTGIKWTAPTSVDIEQNGADRIILKYRDVLPNQPSAVTFGLTVVDVNGKTATVGGLSRNGGAAGDWLTIRYAPEYVGDVSVLTFQSGFDRAHVKSVAVLVAATTNNQNISVTFEGIGTNVGEPSYEAPSFGTASAYDFPANTATTKTFTVTGNPAPDVTWTGKPSWMTITTSATSGGRLVTMSGNPGANYADSNIAFHADVANSLTADAAVRIVVPSPITVTPNAATTKVGVAGPVVVGTATAVPAPTFINAATGLPPGTALSLSGTNIVLTGTPTTAGTYSVSATVGNEFRTATFARTIVVGKVPTITGVGTLVMIRGEAITPVTIPVTGYPAPTLTFAGLPDGLSATGAVITGTPTTTSSTEVTVTASNSFGTVDSTFTIKVGEVPDVTLPASLDAVAGVAVNINAPTSGVPTGATIVGLPDGVTGVLSGGEIVISGLPTRPTSAAGTSGSATVTVSNAFGSTSGTLPWTVAAAPVISGPTSAAATLGTALTAVDIAITGYPEPTVTVTDPDDDGTLLPAGITINTSTPGHVIISGTPTAIGTEHVRISASNGVGGTVTHDLTVSARTVPTFVNAAPTLTVVQGTTKTVTLESNGYPAATLSLQTVLPSWVSFDAATGVLTATPPADIDGTYGPFRIDANNSAGLASAQVSVVVTSPSSLPALYDALLVKGAPSVMALGSVTGFPVPTVTASGLPAGLVLNQVGTALTVSGTPTAPGGTYAVTLTASNGIGADDTASFTITLTAPATLAAPASTSIPVGVPASLTAVLGGFPLPTVTASGLPSSMSIDSTTGEITGTPAVTGTFVVTLTAAGGTGPAPAPQQFTITVTAAPTFLASPAPLTVFYGSTVSDQSFSVAGYPEPTVTAEGLPAGLSLSHTGADYYVSGAATERGVFPVTLTLTNATGSIDRTWNITVQDPASVAVAGAVTVDRGVAITDIPVTTEGYPAPIVTASGLPVGLSLVSDVAGTRITGTPTGEGLYSVHLNASNGVGTPATATIEIAVQSVPSLGADRAVSFPAGETTTLTMPLTGFPRAALTTSTLPSWLLFDPVTGVFTATPSVGDAGPGGVVTVTAISPGGTAHADVTLTVTAPPAVAASGGSVTVLAGDAVSESLTTATGFPVPSVTAIGLPAGLAASLVGNVLTLEGSTTASGSHSSLIVLSNGAGADLYVPWTIVVTAPSALTVPSDTVAVLGHSLDLAIGASGYPNPTVTVTGLPAGLSWVPGVGGGHITGSPTNAGTSTITVTAANGIGADSVQTFELDVVVPEISLDLGASSVAAGGSLHVEGEGFQPDEVVTVVLHSTPVTLATVAADAEGNVSLDVTVPADTPVGSHTLFVTGATGAEGSAPITVTAAAEELSGTGADVTLTLTFAMFLLVLGAAAIGFTRLRRIR